LTNIFAILCSHGTAVSGIIAGLKGNSICTVGVAYNASIVGKIPMNNVAKQTFDLILVFNATFSNISATSWRPVLVVEEVGVPGENHRPWARNW